MGNVSPVCALNPLLGSQEAQTREAAKVGRLGGSKNRVGDRSAKRDRRPHEQT